MAGGRTPMNQLNALPILRADQWATGFTVHPPTRRGRIGNKVVAYWQAADTGMNGVLSNVADPRLWPGHVYMCSDFLDMAGLRSMTLVLSARFMAGGNIDQIQNWIVYALPYGETALGPLNHLPVLPGPNDKNMSGQYASAFPFPRIGQLNQPILTGAGTLVNNIKQGAISFRAGWAVNLYGTATTSFIARFLFSCNQGIDPLRQHLEVWGQS
jgi:hypothetical protein